MNEPKFEIGDKVYSKMYQKFGEIIGIRKEPLKLFVVDFGQKKVPGDNIFSCYKEDLILARDCLHEQVKNRENERVQAPVNLVDYVCNKLDELKELFKRKNQQYSVGGDPLANFRAGALLCDGSDSFAAMYEEAKGYRRKHVVHVERNGIDGDKVDESLDDIIVYSAIMAYMRHCYEQEQSND